MIRIVRAADLNDGDRILSTIANLGPSHEGLINLPVQVWPAKLVLIPTGRRRVHYAPGDFDWLDAEPDYEFLVWSDDA